jgi:hypothetical protein
LSLRIDCDDICSTWIQSSLSAPGNGPGVGGKWGKQTQDRAWGKQEVGFMEKSMNRASAELFLQILARHECKSEPDKF